MHVTEMMTCNSLTITVYFSCFLLLILINYKFTVYVTFSHAYCWREKFSFQTLWHIKLAPKMESVYGAGFWSMCHGYYILVIFPHFFLNQIPDNLYRCFYIRHTFISILGILNLSRVSNRPTLVGKHTWATK